MKDDETLVEDTGYEEWYTTMYRCKNCQSYFMVDDPKFCPTCGKKIRGKITDKETVYYLD